MQLKAYQQDTLTAIREYFGMLDTRSPEEAYMAVTSSPERQMRLGIQRGYVKTALDTPTVAIKVPTGGGKTIIAAHAIKIIAECQGRDYPLVIWFAPSDTIRTQTAEALKKPRHPYRQALDQAFGGNVRVFDLDEVQMISPSDLEKNLCIVVATEQAFVKKEKSKYNVYKHQEDFEPHFGTIRLAEGMDAQAENPSLPNYSFVNLAHSRSPIIIVDEAHKMTSELSRETLTRLNPSAVLGLSATPERGNNTLYSVHASELFDEEMIKLPIELTEFHNQWEQAVFAAIEKRQELEQVAEKEFAKGEGGYLRPLLLFQATKVNGDVPVNALRSFLVETAKLPENEIAVVTGEQKELDGIDVNDPKSPVRYIITVQALKEGWDCPSAYVLCSVANIASNTDTIQLLGRVMRQPGARRRRSPQLNHAYAFVLSSSFGQATSEFAEGLRKKGFEETEAMAAIKPQQLEMFTAEEDLFNQPGVTVVPSDKSAAIVAELPKEVTVSSSVDGSIQLVATAEISDEALNKVSAVLCKSGLPEKAADFQQKVAQKRREEQEVIPAKQHPMVFPKLCANVQGEFCFDSNDALEVVESNLESELPHVLPDGEFEITRAGDSFILELDGNQIRQRFLKEQLTFLQELQTGLSPAEVVNELVRLTRNRGVSPAVMRGWISGVVNHLVTVKGFTSEQLFCFRYKLRDCLLRHLDVAANAAQAKAYQLAFFHNEHPVEVDLNHSFALGEKIYAERPLMNCYHGHYRFSKHFLGTFRIPAFDGKLQFGEGEEFDCAKCIDAHPKVMTWLRNRDRDPDSFCLPLAHAHFYPDFVGQLFDGRIFAVEYKGEQLRNKDDTLEKNAVGRLWADSSHGHCLFAMVFKEDKGLDMREQLNRLFG